MAHYLLWPVGLAWVARRIWEERESPVGATIICTVLWMVGTSVLCLSYPIDRVTLAQHYARAHAAAFIVAVVSIFVWSRRKANPEVEHGAALVLGLIDVAVLAGPYMPPNLPYTHWPLARFVYLCIYLLLVLVNGRFLWKNWTRRTGSSPAASSDVSPYLH
jgi:peptidoglycan/LPS O-acetylase OafA/YrhL